MLAQYQDSLHRYVRDCTCALIVLCLAMPPTALAQSPVQSNLIPAVVTVSPADGAADGLVIGEIDIPARPSRVWQVLTDCAQASRIMANLKKCEILEAASTSPAAQPSWDVRAHNIVWTSLLPPIRSVFKSTYVTEKSIRFERVEGSDLTELKGQPDYPG